MKFKINLGYLMSGQQTDFLSCLPKFKMAPPKKKRNTVNLDVFNDLAHLKIDNQKFIKISKTCCLFFKILQKPKTQVLKCL